MRKHFLLISAAPFIWALVAGEGRAQTPPPAEPSTAGADASQQIAEIVVTAEKRGAESLLKTPVPVAVLDTTQLAEHEQVKLQDYAAEVPGFNVAPSTANQSILSIRGINTGGQNGQPTVGITLDDVPFASSSYLPELDPGDLERIEVLRGPQGTLYGANSMGGLVRFVTVAPSTAAFGGQVSAGTDTVEKGRDVGFNIRGSANIPLSDTLAVRVSGFRREEPGYIYNSLTNQSGINQSTASGGRAAALWRPTNTFSVELTALSQTIASRASDEIVPSLGDLTTNSPKDGTRTTVSVRSYSGLINADVGGVHLTSITGYNTLTNSSRADFSFAFGKLLALQFQVPPYALVLTPGYLTSFTQEGRLATTIGQHLDVELAGFYALGRSTGGLSISPPDPLTGRILLPLRAFNTFASVNHNNEYAGFADATYHFTDRIDVQVGGRISHEDQSTDPYVRYGSFNGPAPVNVAGVRSNSTPFTYLVTPRFQVTPDVLVYARASSGFRQGGSNTTANVPPQYNPDHTYNYELGMKGRFLDGRLTTDFSLYHIDWQQIQIQLRTPNLLLYTGNGGSAKSEGAELTLSVKPFRGTTVSGWVDYDNAVLTKDFVNSPTYGKSGNRIPNTPTLADHISARQSFPLPKDVTVFGEVDASYTGSRLGIFQGTAQRQVYPSYVQTDLQAGFSYKSWQADVYVNNIGDVRGQLNGGIGYANPSEFVLIRPRTVGISVSEKF